MAAYWDLSLCYCIYHRLALQLFATGLHLSVLQGCVTIVGAEHHSEQDYTRLITHSLVLSTQLHTTDRENPLKAKFFEDQPNDAESSNNQLKEQDNVRVHL